MLLGPDSEDGGAVVETAKRRCAKCGARLASDHRSAVCSPCGRRTDSTVLAPPELPASFWSDRDIVAALRDRHFGRFLRAYRRAHEVEITQAALATWLGLTQGQISRIERSPARLTDLARLERWSYALGVPQRLLWFTLGPQAPSAFASGDDSSTLPQSNNEGEEHVRRRQFLKSASVGVALAGSSLLDAVPAAATPHAQLRPIRPEVDIREMTERFRRMDNRYGGGHSRTVVTSYLTSIVEPQLKDVRGGDGARSTLFTAAAEMHQLAGWMSYDVGQPEQGRRHLRHALRLCQESGDDALTGEMFAGMSHHASFHGAPESAVDFAIAARQAAARSGLPALAAEAAVMEAHGLALQGERSASIRALNDAERAFNAADVRDSPRWLSYFDHAYLAAKFGHVFRDLRMPVEAELFARRSLEMSDGYERGRLFNTALLASTLADQRRIGEACELGASAVRMTHTVRSVRSAAYLADVGRRLGPFNRDARVRSLFALMAEAGLPTPRA